MSPKIVELGCPGHFLLAEQCLFRRHTQIGEEYAVSTVGELLDTAGKKTFISGDPRMYYESFVLSTSSHLNSDSCGCHPRKSSDPVEVSRYRTVQEAQFGHNALVKKYHNLLSQPNDEESA